MEHPAFQGKEIFLLTGCTATGKTELSLAWAEHHGAEIVSADSLLFYRGMEIGTAKPSTEERARIRHHLVDVSPVWDRWNVARYVEAAREAVEAIAARGKKALVVGGSGFYLKSFWAPVADEIEIPERVAEEVRTLEARGLDALRERLLEANPGGVYGLDLQNPRRVAKALERCLASGLSVAELRRRHHAQRAPFAEWRIRVAVLERDPGALRERIALRVDRMLESGLIEEVRRLRAEGIERNPSAAGAIGYRETLSYLKGELSREMLVEEIKRNTNRLARKQRTWFRTQLPSGAKRVPLGTNSGPAPSSLFG